MKTNWKDPNKRLVGGGGAAAIAFVCGGLPILTALVALVIKWFMQHP